MKELDTTDMAQTVFFGGTRLTEFGFGFALKGFLNGYRFWVPREVFKENIRDQEDKIEFKEQIHRL